jgi:predicted  nucleic acid-binding Zn-ribbon protein
MKVLTKKANKDYPESGIKKGDTYYQWSFYRQRPSKSKTYPTRAQLTQNDTLQSVYSEYDGDLPKSKDEVESMAASIREAGESAQEKYDNMPEGLQQGDTGQRLEQWAEACSTAADELDTIAETLGEEAERILPAKPEKKKGENDDAYEARLDEVLDEAGIDDQAEYHEFDRDAWTWTLDEDSLKEAISATEPGLD